MTLVIWMKIICLTALASKAAKLSVIRGLSTTLDRLSARRDRPALTRRNSAQDSGSFLLGVSETLRVSGGVSLRVRGR